MNAFTNFMTKAAELYLSAPLFFNWAVSIIVVSIGGLIGLAYWLGSKFAKAESDGLKAQIAALDQRFNTIPKGPRRSSQASGLLKNRALRMAEANKSNSKAQREDCNAAPGDTAPERTECSDDADRGQADIADRS
jgi:hypothetical protein